MEGIQITQVLSDTELREIVTVDGPDGTFDRLKQIFRAQKPRDQPGVCWVNQVADNNDLVGDPIAIGADQAQWLLKDYFKVRGWKRIKTGF